MKKNTAYEYLWLILLLLVLSFLYVHPGGNLLLSGSRTQVMSDGTDAATLPYQYHLVKHWLETSPSVLLYGAIFNPFSDAPDGSLLWMSWIEKVIAIFTVPFVPLEQLSTLMAMLLMVLNGLCCYMFCRSFQWPKPLCVALAICWAFNPFVRGRAKVHIALAGIYFLPLTFWAFHQIKKHTCNRSLAFAAIAFFIAAMAPQYYLITTAFLAPFWIWYVLIGVEKSDYIKKISRLSIASLPAIFLVAWSFLKPIPSQFVNPNVTLRPLTGQTAPNQDLHPFLNTFGARAVDFISGDIAIGASDLNPIRGAINQAIYKNQFDGSNPHERANGIRWVLWAMVIYGFSLWLPKASREQFFSSISQPWVIFFSALTLFSFWMSLSPNAFGISALMPATWFFNLVSQYRVPSRGGVFVHFGVIALAGIFASHLIYKLSKKKEGSKKKTETPTHDSFLQLSYGPGTSSWQKRLTLPVVLPLLVLLDSPPAWNKMPVAPITPQLASLVESGSEDNCGLGMYFPYVSHTYALKEMYYFMQALRGSKCDYLNRAQNDSLNQKLLGRFALHPQVMQAIEQNNPAFQNGLLSFANCVSLEWLAFDEKVPRSWQSDTCNKLGWKLDEQGVCRSPQKNIKMLRSPDQC